MTKEDGLSQISYRISFTTSNMKWHMHRHVKRKSDPRSRGEGQEKENTGGLELTEKIGFYRRT